MLQGFSGWFLDDQDAVEFAEQLWEAAQIWDDVADEGDTKRHNDLAQWMLFGKAQNPFYRRHRDSLDAALCVMYLQWRDATVLERESRASCEKAYMLRAGIYSVFVFMAHLIGGESHSRVVGPDIYRTYGESLNDILKEFGWS